MRSLVAAMGIAIPLAFLQGCASASGEPQPVMLDEVTGKMGVPVAITSLDWLVEECPGIADATEVVYYGGYYAQIESRLAPPGPHDYWRDLVVSLPEGRVSMLADEYGFESTEERPDVVQLLEPKIPGGQLVRSNGFDDSVCAPRHWVRAWASVESDQIVLTVYDS